MDLNKNQLPHMGRLTFLVICAILLTVRLAYLYLADASNFPIKTVKVTASYKHITRDQLENILSEYSQTSFFSFPTARAEKNIQGLDWVDMANIKRVWPDALKITIKEKEPIAVWNSHLVTSKGELLGRQVVIEPSRLPELSGPDEQRKDVLHNFKKLSKLVEGSGLKVAVLKLSENQAWELVLTNGMVLRLGKRDLEKRLDRFCQAYPAVFLGKQDLLSSVDLRYARGMAVQWKEQAGR